MDLERLVDELWCGNHGLGDVSRFLLRALRNDESAAKAEFSKSFRENCRMDCSSYRAERSERMAVRIATDVRLERAGVP